VATVPDGHPDVDNFVRVADKVLSLADNVEAMAARASEMEQLWMLQQALRGALSVGGGGGKEGTISKYV
jgi:hypothetical protein